jgi:mono/diheme cytochrome c family protein
MRSIPKYSVLIATIFLSVVALSALDVDAKFHDAPESAQKMKNPYAGDAAAAQAGKTIYAKNCLSCHGKQGKGTGNIPSLVNGKLE